MSRTGHHQMALVVLVTASACSSSMPVLSDFNPSGLTLPATYETYGEDFDDPETVTAAWAATREGESTDGNCSPGGDGYRWTWTDRPTGNAGDPDVDLFVCDTGSETEAQEAFAATEIENTVVVVTSSPSPVRIDAHSLAADEIHVACVRLAGEVQACSAWSSFARYGPYLVTVTFASKLTWDHLSEEAFVSLATEVDAVVAEGLAEQ